VDIISSLGGVEGVGMVSHWAESSLLIFLVQNCARGILGCVNFEREWFLIIRSVEDRVAGYNRDQLIQRLGTLLGPFEHFPLFEQLCQRSGQMCEAGDKWSLIP
jgi:hypothetical protein